ncbi:hypothetical protein Tco_1272358 [Tanacetum coccineum]
MQSSFKRPSASTRHKGKEIAKPVTPQSESVLGDSDPEQARNAGSQSGLKTTVSLEEMMMGKQAEQVTCKDSEVSPAESCSIDTPLEQDTYVFEEKDDSDANLIAILTLEYRGKKTNGLKQLKKANASLTQELEECKTNLDETSRALGEATSSRDSCLIALQTKQTELEKYTAYDLTIVNQKHDELVKKSLLTRSQFEGQLKEKSKVISDLKVKEGKDIDTMIEMDKQIKFLNEILYKRNQSIQTIHMLAPKCATYHGRSTFANPKYLKKAQSDKPCLYEIPYDTSDPANRFCPDGEETITLEKESRSKLDKDTVKPYNYTYQNSLYETFKPPSKTYLDQLERAKEVRKTMWRKTFVRTKPNIAKNVGFLPMSKSISKIKECECLAQKLSKQTESVNKEVHNNLLKSFAKLEKHSISLELSLQHCKEQMKNNPVCKENASNVFRKEREQYHEIQDLKAQMQDKNMVINELKKLILVTKGKSVETQFDKPSVVRQPNAQQIPKPSVLGKPTPFSNSPEMRSFQTKQSVNKTNVSDGLFKPVTQQNLPKNGNQAVRNTNVLKPGMFRIASTTTQNRTPQFPRASRNTNPHMSKSSGVIHTTSVSRPQLKCYQVKDKVVPNNSHVKFQKKEVEDHHRIFSISKKTKSVTACNDSSNSRTSNANAVCAECGTCVFNSNHDACVSRYLKDVNARTKKPHVVPISASKPKRKANKSVATPHKKTVASDTTIQKSKSYYKKLYENTNQEWKWWIAKRCPSVIHGHKSRLGPKRYGCLRLGKLMNQQIVQLILFIVDSGCTKHMTGNLKLLCNFVEKFLGMSRSKRGNDLLTGSCGSDLYTISLQETTSSTPICFMAKASPTKHGL